MSAELLVRIDRAVGDRHRTRRTHVVHALRGSTVAIAREEAQGVVTGRVAVATWPHELAALCDVPVPGHAPTPPGDGPDLPWEILVGSGRALADGRADLYDELVARADDPVRAQLGLLHRGTLGRLRVVGVIPSRRRVGWLSWVLVADGWRALTPYAASGVAMVRLERRRRDDLATEVARWAATAR